MCYLKILKLVVKTLDSKSFLVYNSSIVINNQFTGDTKMTLKMTEAEAMTELVGKPVTITRPTHSGTETILGSVTTPLLIEEEEGEEVITFVTIEGNVISRTITGLPLPLEADEAVTLEMVPASEIEI